MNENIANFEDFMSEKYGKIGSPEREKFREEARIFCIGQVLQEARKSEKLTQTELAKRIGKDKSYISKIENGIIDPSATIFYKLIEAIGLKIEITRPIF